MKTNKAIFRGAIAAIALLLAASARAATVEATATSLGGNLWSYELTLDNTAPDLSFDELTVFLDHTQFANLTANAAPAGWDVLVVQPDVSLSSDGFFDAIDLGGYVGDGARVSGFSFSVEFLGVGSPGALRFDLIDSTVFATIDSGITTAATVTPVPEPQTYALMLGGLLAIAFVRRKRPTTAVQC